MSRRQDGQYDGLHLELVQCEHCLGVECFDQPLLQHCVCPLVGFVPLMLQGYLLQSIPTILPKPALLQSQTTSS